ncbi:MAG: class I tRNA ligase family protein [Bacteroidales bacterium]|jgi:leucyl-tRNA synthetase|nr:class I tRNA ligase family protein [Bacteroidales bacterium]
MEYNFKEIEKKWRTDWEKSKIYKVDIDYDKQKYYVLDMFPYPSGAGLHVGHPLGYIASDIYARYKKLQGFNVLHPMGFDAFGLPAEQYAIQTGQHPAITTEKNISRYREQLDLLGFSFDWSREVITCDPKYYKWTQWTFIKLFKSWYDKSIEKARPIDELIKIFEREGNANVNAATTQIKIFSDKDWVSYNEKEQQDILMNYRLAYLSETFVNWCPALGTVLANDEVADGYSIRGGYPVERKKMKQWLLRITAYAERLLAGLEKIDWPEHIKEVQRNWIGRSEGAVIRFPIKDVPEKYIEIFTTRPDTIFGVTYVCVAPESELVPLLTKEPEKDKVEDYVKKSLNKSERERLADIDKKTGVFTGSYAINPFTGVEIPIWIADYVLASYGTGAVMAVPAHDSRDYAFAKQFGLPIKEVIKGGDISKEAYEDLEGECINSDFINGLKPTDAIQKVIEVAEKRKFGSRKISYRLRDAIFSRQRYWGEPFPIYYKDGIPYPLDESKLPLELPPVDSYLPTEDGKPPLARAENWKTEDGYPLETCTMPGFAGSSAYYLRYMDPNNDNELVSKKAVEYWRNVDLYIGGSEHATGHLIYARFWNKFLFDIGIAVEDEPFVKLINQGMILGRSNFVYRAKPVDFAIYKLKNILPAISDNYEIILQDDIITISLADYKTYIFVARNDNLENAQKLASSLYANNYKILIINIAKILLENNLKDTLVNEIKSLQDGEIKIIGRDMYLPPIFVSKNIEGREEYTYPMHVDISLVRNDILDIEAFKKWQPEFENAYFVLEENKYICGWEVEKMSKSKYNVQNPDDVVNEYGADTLRLYEMFLGPVEQSKPWDVAGIEGVHRFLRKFWRLFFDAQDNFYINDDEPTRDELQLLHKTLKKVQEDIERYAYNTAISSFMVAVNNLQDLHCNKRAILEPLMIALSPFAPFITEELWHLAGHTDSIHEANFPIYDEKYTTDDTCTYAISFNGKTRFTLDIDIAADEVTVKNIVLEHPQSQKWLEGKEPKRVIVVKGKIVNIVM